jgi:hypothetical protein
MEDVERNGRLRSRRLWRLGKTSAQNLVERENLNSHLLITNPDERNHNHQN